MHLVDYLLNKPPNLAFDFDDDDGDDRNDDDDDDGSGWRPPCGGEWAQRDTVVKLKVIHFTEIHK